MIIFVLVLVLAASAAAPGTAAAAASDGKITALGRIEPGDGVIHLGAPAGERVYKLEVSEGQEVAAGAVLASFESFGERLADRDVRKALVREATLSLEEARTIGVLDISSQEASVAILASDRTLADSDLARLEALSSQLVTAQDLERQRTTARRAADASRQGEIVLEKMKRQHDLNVTTAEARLVTARAQLSSAEALLARASLRAPVSGRVIKIYSWPGEVVATGPIMDMGESKRVYAVAEVYESDIRSVAKGQPATVTSPALAGALTGTVERIGSMIYKKDVLGIDPTAPTDARVVEVRIRLDHPEAAAALVHLQVDVAIDKTRR
ncbi:MAG TPA: efflux RND transporter periplasmic adaptor subunit [Vicinamibacteria bacterium]|nr:efflux RND transporter periplasmic adaptor subunit [Vicinamibacteria bacterium]